MRFLQICVILFACGLIALDFQRNDWVAARPLPAGTILRTDDIRPGFSLHGLLVDRSAPQIDLSAAEILGAALRTRIAEGESIDRQAIVRQGEAGFLKTALVDGARAVSISACTKRSDQLEAGDRVAIGLTQKIAVDGSERALLVSETIERDLRLIFVSKETGRNYTRGCEQQAFVLVEAPKKIAEKLAIASKLGVLFVNSSVQ